MTLAQVLLIVIGVVLLLLGHILLGAVLTGLGVALLIAGRTGLLP